MSFGPRCVVALVRDYLCVWFAWPFSQQVVGVEIMGSDSPLVAMLAYLCHSIGEGLSNLDCAIRWAKGRSPQVLVGMGGNGHNPWWGPPSTCTNPVGDMIADLILALDLEVANHPECPPTYVSDIGHNT